MAEATRTMKGNMLADLRPWPAREQPECATPDAHAAGRGAAIPLHLLVALLAVAVFLTLFVLRALDDNRLVSWQWVFADGEALRLLPALLVGLALAYALARQNLLMNRRPKAATAPILQNPPLPLAGEGSGRGCPLPLGEGMRVREETARFMGTIRGSRLWPGGLSLRYPATGLFFLAFGLAVPFWSAPEAIVDAARYFTQAKLLAQHGAGYFLNEWGGAVAAWTDLPLVPFLYGLVFSIFGEQRSAIQIFTTLLFSGTVLLTYLIGRRLWSESLGFTAGALLLGVPYLFTQVPLMLVDVPAMFVLTLTIYAALQARARGGRWIAIAALAGAAALLTKYSLWLLLSIVPVIFLSRPIQDGRTALPRASAVLFGAVLLAGGFLFWKFDIVAAQLELLMNYQAPGLRRWEEGYVSTFLFQIHPFISVAALGSVLVALKAKDRRYLIVAWLPLLVVILEIKRMRYLVPVLPMLALTAAYGLCAVRDAVARRFIVASIMVSAFVVAAGAYLPFLTHTSAINLTQAGTYLDTLGTETAEIITLPQARAAINPAVSVPLLDLFTRTHLVYRPDGHVPPAGVETSALRFTWEYPTPRYYDGRADRAAAPVVVIAAERAQALPAAVIQRLQGYRLTREFTAMDDAFGYQTLIQIYRPALAAQQELTHERS